MFLVSATYNYDTSNIKQFMEIALWLFMESSFGNDFVCKLWVMQDYRALIFDLHVFTVVEAWDITQHIFYTYIFSVTQAEIKTVFIVLQKKRNIENR